VQHRALHLKEKEEQAFGEDLLYAMNKLLTMQPLNEKNAGRHLVRKFFRLYHYYSNKFTVEDHILVMFFVW
jgi:hypothetical protein